MPIVDLDKPWLVDRQVPSPTNPEQDVLYMSYTEFEQTYSLLYADELAFLSEPILATVIETVSSTVEDDLTGPVAVSPKVYYGYKSPYREIQRRAATGRGRRVRDPCGARFAG